MTLYDRLEINKKRLTGSGLNLIRAEENLKVKGYVNKSSEEILANIKERTQQNGDL